VWVKDVIGVKDLFGLLEQLKNVIAVDIGQKRTAD